MLHRIGLILAILAPSALAEDWPHWRGPGRDDISSEPSGWNGNAWPLEEIWEIRIGDGASSPLVIDDRLYIMSWHDDREHLRCLNAATADEIWHVDYPAPQYGRQSTGDKGIYAGISSTPEYDPATGWLYSLGIDGDLRCWDTNREGALVWSLNLYDEYNAPQRPDVGGRGNSQRDYGYTSSPLVHGDMLVVEVGDTRNGTVKGFDKRTGEELWTSECRDEAGHSGAPVPINVDGIDCAIVLTMRNLIAVRLDRGHTGETLAEFPWTTDFANNIPTPAIDGNRVIVTTSYNQAAMCCLEISRRGFNEIWKVENPSGVCSPVIHDGHIYWAWRGIHCVNLDNGEERWMGPKVGTPGSCILTSDDRLIVQGDRGDLYLVETAGRSPDDYNELARHRAGFPSEAWAHVVLSSGRLYCKGRRGRLKCFLIGE